MVKVHPVGEKPPHSTGLSTFKWVVESPATRIGYGGTFDITMHTEAHKQKFWDDYDTYQA